ncbi:MAG: response regulator [Alphaproteobacteria bacterium]|nr:response regulator [Alphaproteobacteria bacterium]MDE2492460.1 response regulator [Alphaproteobacteria bacterium]
MSKPSKVLVVDDDDVVRLSYQRSLQAANCNVEVDAAPNGEAALEALERKRFDVVLLDLRMPGMDGMSVLRSIKRDWPKSGVIVITGYPTIESAKEAIRLGAYDYLAKPVSPAEIVNAASGAITQTEWTLHQNRASGEVYPAAATGPNEATRKLDS